MVWSGNRRKTRKNKAEGALVFAKACEMGLEGIVSKREGSLNKSGPSRSWLKTKNPYFVRDEH
jgi:ATP-dependent DNA ligase